MRLKIHRKICLFTVIILNICACSFGNTLKSSELIQAGYFGIIFGDQNTRGISLYDLNNKKIRNIILGEHNIEYAYPVYSGGKLYCIRKTVMNGSVESDVIHGSIAGEFTSIPTTKFSSIYNICISNDGSNIAILVKSNGNLKLVVTSLQNNKILANIAVDVIEADTAKLVWSRDDNMIFLFEKPNSGKGYDLRLNKLKETSNPPLYCNKKSCILVADNEYLIDDEYSKKNIIVTKKTAHSLSLSKDGKYFIYGWLRGAGFETFCITDIASGAILDLKINHSGTALGLQLI